MAEGLLKVDEWLTDSLKWIVRGLQLSGYFPFSIRNGKLELAKYSTVLLAWSTLLIVLTFAHVFTFITDLQDFLGDVPYGEIEKLTVRGLAVLLGLVSSTIKILPLLYRKSLMHFWTENCKILQFLACHGSDRFKLQRILDDLAKRSNRLIFALAAATPVIVFALNLRRAPQLFDSILRTRWWYFFKVMGNYTFWMFLSLIDGFFWLSISYFLRLYTSIFTKLREKLRNMNKAVTLSYNQHLHSGLAVQRGLYPKGDDNLEMDLAHIIESFSRVERSIAELNNFFGSVVVLEMGLSVTYVLVYSFSCVSGLLGGQFMFAFGLAIWCIMFASRLFILGTDSSNMSTAALDMASEFLVSARGKAYFGHELSQHVKLMHCSSRFYMCPSVSRFFNTGLHGCNEGDDKTAATCTRKFFLP